MQDKPKPRSGVGKLYSRSKSTDGVASVVTRPLPTIPGDIVERLDDIIKWVDGNRACIWKDEDVADLRAAKAEIERLRNSFLPKTEAELEALKLFWRGEGYAVGCLKEKALREVLKAYELWEADVILADECWFGGLPRITRPLWDRFIEIQTMRNTALSTSNDSGER